MSHPNAYVYVDGFNLYYGAVKGTPYKWLDLAALSRFAFPRYFIDRIHYFTARVGRLRGDTDPSKPQRQQVYLRALGTIPNLDIHYGRFLLTKTRMALVDPPPGGPRTAEVFKTEEKGSDVNLASYLLLDAFDGRFDVAIVVSNDSDLSEPIRIVRERFDRPVIVLSPYRTVSYELRGVATYFRTIRRGWLEASQFPDVLRDEHGVISKPEEWR